MSHSPKGWHGRGYLPHCDFSGLVQGLTFRLHDAVPHRVIAAWKRELNWIEKRGDAAADSDAEEEFDRQRRELHRRLATYEDAGRGACHLRNPEIAEVAQSALLHFEGERYLLLAWCIMPNHVHVLIRPRPGWSIGRIVHSWKRFISRRANVILGTSGPFWGPDYYDRYVRDEAHYARAIYYIHTNPVKANLCAGPQDWLWSSCKRNGARVFNPPLWNGFRDEAAPS